jgi:hypothetical protein
VKLSALDTIELERSIYGQDENIRVFWEVIEFPSVGNNAAVVRYHDIVTIAHASGQQDQVVSGISTIGDCVPFICGVLHSSGNPYWSDASVTAEMYTSGSDYVRLKRGGTALAADVSVAVVEFTGTSWAVQNDNEHNYSSAGANETETITDVADWSHAFIVASHRCDLDNNDELGWICWPGSSTTTVRFRINTAATNPGNHYTIAHVIRNDSMDVQHLDSVTGSGTDHPVGSAAPQQIETSITAVNDPLSTSLVASADDNDISPDYPQPFWGYTLNGDDEVTWWRGRYNSVAEWALQVVEWPLVLGEMSGTAAGTSTADGNLEGDGALAGTIAGTSTADGDLEGDGALAGTIDGTSTATGHMSRLLEIRAGIGTFGRLGMASYEVRGPEYAFAEDIPPEITVISPAAGTPIQPDTTLVVEVTDNVAVALAPLYAEFPGQDVAEVVYDGDDLLAPYVALSSVVDLANGGKRFSLRR